MHPMILHKLANTTGITDGLTMVNIHAIRVVMCPIKALSLCMGAVVFNCGLIVSRSSVAISNFQGPGRQCEPDTADLDLSSCHCSGCRNYRAGSCGRYHNRVVSRRCTTARHIFTNELEDIRPDRKPGYIDAGGILQTRFPVAGGQNLRRRVRAGYLRADEGRNPV